MTVTLTEFAFNQGKSKYLLDKQTNFSYKERDK